MEWFAALMGMALVVSPVFAQEQQKADPARVLFNTGRDLWDDGKYADAEKAFREVLVKYQKSDQADKAAYYLITTLAKLGRVREAVTEISNFQKNYPKSKWLGDVHEKQISLTNQVPQGLEHILTLQNHILALKNPHLVNVQNPTPLSAGGFQSVKPFNIDVSPTDPEVSLQQEILRVMLRNDPDRAIDVATERLKADPSDPVVISNLTAIAMSRSAMAMPFLMMIARSSAGNPKARQQAIFALERRGADIPNRLALLEELYKGSSDNADVRRSVVSSLGRIPDPQAIPILNNIARNDPDVSIRRSAIQSLGLRKEPEALKALEGLLKAPARP